MKLVSSRRQPNLYLGIYEALEPLGEGGMGKVFLGKHRQTGQQVVIKVMHDELLQDSRQLQRFRQEMQFMMRFRHPHAVTLLDGSLEANDRNPPCIIMEYIPGVTLEKLIEQQNRLAPVRVGKMLGQLCSVLHAAHGGGLLHRDLSAVNVMVMHAGTTSESIKVMDFGLANLDSQTGGFYVPLEKLDNNEQSSFGPGTPDYISPEQIRGEEVDHRADLYAVGVLLFQALTGQVPFQDCKEVKDILRCQVHKAPPRFSALGVRDVPSALEAVVQCCLSKQPGERPQSAKELAELYEAAVGAPLLAKNAFEHQLQESLNPRVARDPSTVIGTVQAWMPEQIAVMKLRAFVEAIGGEVVESSPGLIRVSVPDPRREPEPNPSGFLSMLGIGRRTIVPKVLNLELLMEKKVDSGRGNVEISLILVPEKSILRTDDIDMRKGFGQRLFRELKAYLVTG